jgi:phosphohistidine phosphatase
MIWLLRHGEAADGSPDADRPLTERGAQDSRAAGAAMAALGVSLDACLTSPKLRALDTARLACEPLELEPIADERLSGGPFDADELTVEHGEDILLVGHDPDFSAAVHRMTGAQVRMRKGGLAGVSKGELRVLLRPRELAAIAERHA